MKLVLFDIDGTLLESGGAGTRALNYAFRDVFSVENAFEGIRMSGKTDIEIIKEAMARRDGAHEDKIPPFIEAYLKHLRVEIENPLRRLKPGVDKAINILNVLDGAGLGLLTGNIEEGARIKLEPFGLNEYFSIGAFGSDNEDRVKLFPIAVERFCCRFRVDVKYKDCVVIGDTPRDIACAKPYGAFTLAVATGSYTATELLTSGADLVMTDLADTGFLLRALNL